MTSKLPTLCDACKNLRRNGFSCVAYPNRIPDDIRVWAGDHRQVRLGQVGDTVFQVEDAQLYREWQLVYDKQETSTAS